MAARRTTNCATCENSNLASVCAVCVNYRLNDYSSLLKSLKNVRDSLFMRLSGELMAKKKADDQLEWRVFQNEKILNMKKKLCHLENQLYQGNIELDRKCNDLKVRYALLKSASSALDKNRVDQLEKFYPSLIGTQNLRHMHITSERLHKQSVIMKQICKLFPQRRVNLDGDKRDASSGQFDQICNARLPRGLDPHSVPTEDLAASLGYMVQLLNLVVHILAAPVLHNSGFAGSCSRIWQRHSYWDARPSSRSNEYPLFIPRQNSCSSSGDNSWSDGNCSNYGVASVESEKKLQFGSPGNTSFNYSSASAHSVETHKDLQRGISLLKKSVACITAYGYNSLYLEVPSDTSTFEAFGKLLMILSSSKEVRAVLSMKMTNSRSYDQVQHVNKCTWNATPAISSRNMVKSANTPPIMRSLQSHSNSVASFFYATETADPGKSESLAEGWDIVEHPPSESEDIEDWTRAMMIDVTRT